MPKPSVARLRRLLVIYSQPPEAYWPPSFDLQSQVRVPLKKRRAAAIPVNELVTASEIVAMCRRLLREEQDDE